MDSSLCLERVLYCFKPGKRTMWNVISCQLIHQLQFMRLAAIAFSSVIIK